VDVPALLPVTADELKDPQKLTDGSEGRQKLDSGDRQDNRSAAS